MTVADNLTLIFRREAREYASPCTVHVVNTHFIAYVQESPLRYPHNLYIAKNFSPGKNKDYKGVNS